MGHPVDAWREDGVSQHLVRRHVSGQRHQFAVIAFDPEPCVDVSGVQGAARPAQGLARRSAGRTRRQDVAARCGWKIGDKVPIRGTIWQRSRATWFFNIDAIYDGDQAIDKTNFFSATTTLTKIAGARTGRVGW